MWSSLFSWATDLEELCSSDNYSQFFDHYFMQSDVCMWTFLIGAGIAAAVCGIFYFVICNKVYALSNRWVWLAALVISCVSVFFVSDIYMKGHDGGDSTASSGLYLDSYTLQDEYAEELQDNIDQLAEWNALADDFRQELSTGEFNIITNMALVNTVYAFVIFIMMSFCVKGTTVHGKKIPV